MSAKHTPTPWETYPEYDGRVHIVRAGSVKHSHGRTQADWIAELDDDSSGHSADRIAANATLIVRAVNAHDALVDALELCLAAELDLGGSPARVRVIRAALEKAR